MQLNGALRDMVCRGMMLMLHREGLIRQVRRTPDEAMFNSLLQQHH